MLITDSTFNTKPSSTYCMGLAIESWEDHLFHHSCLEVQKHFQRSGTKTMELTSQELQPGVSPCWQLNVNSFFSLSEMHTCILFNYFYFYWLRRWLKKQTKQNLLKFFGIRYQYEGQDKISTDKYVTLLSSAPCSK